MAKRILSPEASAAYRQKANSRLSARRQKSQAAPEQNSETGNEWSKQVGKKHVSRSPAATKPTLLQRARQHLIEFFSTTRGKYVAVLALFLCTVIITLSLLPGGLRGLFDRSRNSDTDQAGAPGVAFPTSSPVPRTDLTILLLGYGGGTHDGGKLTDTLMLAKIDSVSRSISLISVPRDLWVPLPLQPAQPLWSKINGAFAIGSDETGYQYRLETFKGQHGGGTLAKEVIGAVTGITPDYYVAVNFDTFTSAIDTIGPLKVTVPYTFDDQWYPIRGEERNACGYTEQDIATISAVYKNGELEKQFPCRYEQLHFEKGQTYMDGATALKFVRSRHGDVGGSDFGRSERQQALLDAVKKRVFSLSFLPKIIPLAEQFSTNIQTDLSVTDLPSLLARFGNVTEYQTHTITITDANVLMPGKSADRQFILLPREGQGNWSGIRYFVKTELEKATASAEVATPAADLAPAQYSD